MEDEEEAELRNPFPSPPSHYTKYFARNLELLALLRERAGEATGSDDPLAAADQHALLADQRDVPEWPLAQLAPPRVDWILEEGSYTVFGDTWYVSTRRPCSPRRADATLAHAR